MEKNDKNNSIITDLDKDDEQLLIKVLQNKKIEDEEEVKVILRDLRKKYDIRENYYNLYGMEKELYHIFLKCEELYLTKDLEKLKDIFEKTIMLMDYHCNGSNGDISNKILFNILIDKAKSFGLNFNNPKKDIDYEPLKINRIIKRKDGFIGIYSSTNIEKLFGLINSNFCLVGSSHIKNTINDNFLVKKNYKEKNYPIKDVSKIYSHLKYTNKGITIPLKYFTDDKCYYEIMPLRKEGDLLENIEKINYPSLFIFSQLFQGLENLHLAGCVHRDLHMGNILLDKNICTISDFNFSYVLGMDVENLDLNIGWAFKFEMPSETLSQQKDDVYCFGFLLIGILLKKYPSYKDYKVPINDLINTIPLENFLTKEIIENSNNKKNVVPLKEKIVSLINHTTDLNSEKRFTIFEAKKEFMKLSHFIFNNFYIFDKSHNYLLRETPEVLVETFTGDQKQKELYKLGFFTRGNIGIIREEYNKKLEELLSREIVKNSNTYQILFDVNNNQNNNLEHTIKKLSDPDSISEKAHKCLLFLDSYSKGPNKLLDNEFYKTLDGLLLDDDNITEYLMILDLLSTTRELKIASVIYNLERKLNSTISREKREKLIEKIKKHREIFCDIGIISRIGMMSKLINNNPKLSSDETEIIKMLLCKETEVTKEERLWFENKEIALRIFLRENYNEKNMVYDLLETFVNLKESEILKALPPLANIYDIFTNSDLKKAFYTALKNNNTKMLDLILNNKELDLKEIFDYNISDHGMEHILGLIVDSDNTKLLDLFMEKKAKISDVYHYAVDFAVKKNKMQIFNHLLDKYNRVDDVLHTIINNDNVALLDYLFKEKKLDLEKLEDHHLEFALMNEKTKIVEYLVDSKIIEDLVNKIITDKKQLDGKSLLDFSLNFAMEHRQPRMLDYLFDKVGFDINKYNPFGHNIPYDKNIYPKDHPYGKEILLDKTLLHYAIESGNQILFDNLINNKKIDLTKNVKDSDNHNAFNMLIELNKKIQNDIECKNGESDINDLNKNLYMVKSLYEKLNYKDRNGFGESLVKIKGLDINIKREAALERLLRAAECGVPETTESIINLCKEEEKKCGEKILDINKLVPLEYLGRANDGHRYTPFQLALKYGNSPKTTAVIYYHLNDEERKKNEAILAENKEKIKENVFDKLLFYCTEKDDIEQFSDLIDSDRVKFDTEEGGFDKKDNHESINDVALKNKSMNVMAEIILRSENRRKLYEYFMSKLDEALKNKLKETIIKVDKNKKSNQQTNEKKDHKKPSDFKKDNNLIGKIGDCSGEFDDLFPSDEDIYKKKFGKDLKNFSKDLDFTLKEKGNKNYIPDIRNNIEEAFREYSQQETQTQQLDINNNSPEELDVDSILERILNEKPIKSSSKKQTRTEKIKVNKQKDIKNNSFYEGFDINI